VFNDADDSVYIQVSLLNAMVKEKVQDINYVSLMRCFGKNNCVSNDYDSALSRMVLLEYSEKLFVSGTPKVRHCDVITSLRTPKVRHCDVISSLRIKASVKPSNHTLFRQTPSCWCLCLTS